MRRQRNVGPDFLYPHNIDQGHLNSTPRRKDEQILVYRVAVNKSAFLNFVKQPKECIEKSYISLLFVKNLPQNSAFFIYLDAAK